MDFAVHYPQSEKLHCRLAPKMRRVVMRVVNSGNDVKYFAQFQAIMVQRTIAREVAELPRNRLQLPRDY